MRLSKVTSIMILCALYLIPAAGVGAQSGTFSLGLYQGVQLSDSKIVESKDPAADLTVSPRYKGYVAYAALEAKKLEEFETKPNIANLTVADVEGFHELAFAPAPGFYYLVKSNDNRYYLCKLERFENQGKAAAYWKLTFSYEEIRLKDQRTVSTTPQTPQTPKTLMATTTTNNGASHGKEVYPDGSTYEGDFVNGEFHGKGILRSPEGSYEGDFVNGEFQGWGVLTLSDGTYYEGEFAAGTFHGKGNLRLPNGASYKGDFVMGKLQGWGVLTLSDGTYYEGEFADGKCHGQGRMYDANGRVQQEGQWANNRFIGPVQADTAIPSGDLYYLDDDNRFFDLNSMKHVEPSSKEADVRFWGPSGSKWYFIGMNGASIQDLGPVGFTGAQAPGSGYTVERTVVEQDHAYAVRCGDGSYYVIKITAYDPEAGTAGFVAKPAEPGNCLNLYYLNGDNVRFDLETRKYAPGSRLSDLCFKYFKTAMMGENGASIKDLGIVDYESAKAPLSGYTTDDIKPVKNHVYAVKTGSKGLYVIKITNVVEESDIEFIMRTAEPESANSIFQGNQPTMPTQPVQSPPAIALSKGTPVIVDQEKPGPDQNGKPAIKGEIHGGKYIYDGKVIMEIPGSLDWACISPNGKYVAYRDGQEINYYDIEKKEHNALYRLTTDEYMGKYVHNYGFTSPTNYDFVSWSEDSQYIVVNRWTKDIFKGGSGNYKISIADRTMTFMGN